MNWLADIQWLFFDLGCTLVSEDRVWQERARQIVRALADMGRSVTEQQVTQAYTAAIADSAPRVIVRTLEEFADDEVTLDYLLGKAKYRNEFEELYPGAQEVLAELAPRYRTGIVANQSAGMEKRLARFGLLPYLSFWLSSSAIGLFKPEPAIFNLALAQTGCQTHQAVMIGDRIDNDVRPAKALGWHTVRLRQGLWAAAEPRCPEEEADVTVNDLAELQELLLF